MKTYYIVALSVLMSIISCSIFKSQKVELEGKLLASDWKIPIKAELKWLSDGVCIGKTRSDTNGVLNFRVDRKVVGVENILIVSPFVKNIRKDTVFADRSKFYITCKGVDTLEFFPNYLDQNVILYTKFEKLYVTLVSAHGNTLASPSIVGKWMQIDIEVNGISVWDNTDRCLKDDISVFRAGKVFESNEGAIICDSDHDPIIDTSSWSWITEGSKLNVGKDIFEVEKLDSEDLILVKDDEGNEHKLYFKRQ